MPNRYAGTELGCIFGTPSLLSRRPCYECEQNLFGPRLVRRASATLHRLNTALPRGRHGRGHCTCVPELFETPAQMRSSRRLGTISGASDLRSLLAAFCLRASAWRFSGTCLGVEGAAWCRIVDSMSSDIRTLTDGKDCSPQALIGSLGPTATERSC